METSWVHAIDGITFQAEYDRDATLVTRVEVRPKRRQWPPHSGIGARSHSEAGNSG